MPPTKPLLLAEISGPYGPVCIHERILQKIWWRGDYRQGGDLRTQSGKTLRCLKPGRWNHNEGPDFIGALIELDGQLQQGDIEVHFYAEDWTAHGHDEDPAFDNVILHLLLFPPRRTAPLPTRSGRVPETLILLPHLKEDLEDYANNEALLALESRNKTGWQEALMRLNEEERLPLLRAKAMERWGQKIRFARMRLDSHGWGESCHQLALETLGLKRNRAPMAVLAQRYPLAEMRDATAAALFAGQRGSWHLAGLRPPNHPLKRLQQYLNVLAAHPDWPVRLLALGEGLSGEYCSGEAATTNDTARFRKVQRLTATARRLQGDLFDNLIGGTRLHTLVVDALLPLLAAHGVKPEICERYWFHWLLGDIPDKLASGLRGQLPPEGSRVPVVCNGLFQGLLQLSHEHG